MILIIKSVFKDDGTSPAGPVLAGPLFHGGFNIFALTKNKSKSRILIILWKDVMLFLFFGYY